MSVAQSNYYIGRLPKLRETGEPVRKFRLLAGVHCDHNGVHRRGDIVESNFDLVALHGRDRFQPLFRYGTAEESNLENVLYETEAGSETADELAARIRAETLAEMNVPKQCHLFGDCLLADGHEGPCGFARQDIEERKAKSLQAATSSPAAKPAPKVSPTKVVKPVSNATPMPPNTAPNKVKSPTSQWDDLTVEELKEACNDEERDISKCVTKEDYIKLLSGGK